MARPYSKTMKFRIVATKEVEQYRNKSGEVKECLICAGCDGEKVMKIKVYDPAKFSKFKVENTVVMRDVIDKTTDGIIVTKTSKVYLSADIPIIDTMRAQGRLLVNPPPSPLKTLQEALLSPQKVMVSVSGKVESEEAVRTVNVKGEDVPIKTLHLSDTTTPDCKVTLWRGQSSTDIRPGDYVTVTDVVISTFRNETSLSGTSRSTVKKGDAPTSCKTVSIVAISTDEQEYELLLDDDRVVKVDRNLVDGDIEKRVRSGPLTANITFKGADTIAITFE